MVFGYNGPRPVRSDERHLGLSLVHSPLLGDPGVLRLFNTELAGQIAWLIPATLAAIVVLFVLRYRRTIAILVGVWFLTFAAMFSIVDGIAQFYTAALAVPMGLAIGVAFAHARRLGVVWAQARSSRAPP